MSTSTTKPDNFFQEYTSPEAISKYTRATAGYGISYLLKHDYMEVYNEAIGLLPSSVADSGIRLLEFGCGAGMNLVNLVAALSVRGTPVDRAIGTDFSPVLIEAANREAADYLPNDLRSRLQFHVARNETIIQDVAAAASINASHLKGSFHFVFGVNTTRYCHRAKKELDCARDILDLLTPGGICVVIDMNDRFPAFRSALKGKLRGQTQTEEECYIPSLEEYTAPFHKAGFEVLRSEHFCWIPHSSGPFMCRLLTILSPLLNALARSRAMRSLIVARKPGN